MFKAERDRLVEDWRQCRADFESEQNLGLGGPTYTTMVQGTQHMLQPKVMLVLPHLQASELGKNKIVPYNAADAQTAEEYDYFDPESWL
ncbi:DNA-helicase RecQ [Sesbania bispinosa]|nr:DNA-helicase RecQ [Sesbania bispinosa]